MSDVDVQKAIRVLKVHGCLQTVVQLALHEGLPDFSDEQIRELKAHLEFLSVRRSAEWSTRRGKWIVVRDMQDDYLTTLAGACKTGRARPSAFWRNLITQEMIFRGLSLDAEQMPGSQVPDKEVKGE